MGGSRGTTNRNARGSAEQRRRRKRALLERDGDGKKAACWECGTFVTLETMICDRVKTGVDGGTYALENVRVHCRLCSEKQGRRMSAETRRWKAWRKQGIRRSRVGPGGVRHLDRWCIFLSGRFVGYVKRDDDGWGGYSYDIAWHVVAEGLRTYDGALYALLCAASGYAEPR